MTDNRTTELLRELRDLACDIHAAEIIDHVHITNRGWTFDSQWLDSWHNEFDRITNELNSRAERTCRNVWDVELTGRLRFQCSECGAVSLEITPRFCPNCGTKVVGE